MIQKRKYQYYWQFCLQSTILQMCNHIPLYGYAIQTEQACSTPTFPILPPQAQQSSLSSIHILH